jgi:hypothetical protein
MRGMTICMLVCMWTYGACAQIGAQGSNDVHNSANAEATGTALRQAQAALSELQQPFLVAEAQQADGRHPADWRRNFEAANAIIRRALMTVEMRQFAGEDLLTIYELGKDFELAASMLNPQPSGPDAASQETQRLQLRKATDKLADANQQLFSVTKMAIHDLILQTNDCVAH